MFPQLISTVVALILLLCTNSAIADLPDERSVGVETRRWLELQSSGAAASKTRQTVSGPVADAIYKRYVKSFEHPIPEFYKSKQDDGQGGSSK